MQGRHLYLLHGSLMFDHRAQMPTPAVPCKLCFPVDMSWRCQDSRCCCNAQKHLKTSDRVLRLSLLFTPTSLTDKMLCTTTIVPVAPSAVRPTFLALLFCAVQYSLLLLQRGLELVQCEL